MKDYESSQEDDIKERCLQVKEFVITKKQSMPDSLTYS
jgi:hypothetical protein